MSCGVTKGSRHLFLKIISFIYLFWLHRLFSSCDEWGLLSSCSVQASHCGGFSCCRALALRAWASVVVEHGLNTCNSRRLEHKLNCCGAWLSCFPGMWDLLRPEIEPVSRGLTHLPKLQKQMQDQLHNDRR